MDGWQQRASGFEPTWRALLHHLREWAGPLEVEQMAARSEVLPLRFAWWNTGVAPTVGRLVDSNHEAKAMEVVARLVLEEGCALIGLAEVYRQRIWEWIPASERAHWGSISPRIDAEDGYDLGVLYDRRQLDAVNFHWLSVGHAGRRVRPGVVVEFETQGEGVAVVLAHWPSSMGDGDTARDRRGRAASAVRAAVASLSLRDVPVLVMGDLNLEPFDRALGSDLPTSRYRDAVLRHRARDEADILLYNASWRWLGEKHARKGHASGPSLAGTYRTRDRTPTAWRTFDQVMVSGTLLGNRGWALQEAGLGVWSHEAVFSREKSRPEPPFDHLPIVGELEWLAPDEAQR